MRLEPAGGQIWTRLEPHGVCVSSHSGIVKPASQWVCFWHFEIICWMLFRWQHICRIRYGIQQLVSKCENVFHCKAGFAMSSSNAGFARSVFLTLWKCTSTWELGKGVIATIIKWWSSNVCWPASQFHFAIVKPASQFHFAIVKPASQFHFAIVKPA